MPASTLQVPPGYVVKTPHKPRLRHWSRNTDPPEGLAFWQLRPEVTLCGQRGDFTEEQFAGLPNCKRCLVAMHKKMNRPEDPSEDTMDTPHGPRGI